MVLLVLWSNDACMCVCVCVCVCVSMCMAHPTQGSCIVNIPVAPSRASIMDGMELCTIRTRLCLQYRHRYRKFYCKSGYRHIRYHKPAKKLFERGKKKVNVMTRIRTSVPCTKALATVQCDLLPPVTRCLRGHSRRSKVRPWQLMKQPTVAWTVGPERRCEVGVVVRRWCCSAHTGNEVSLCGRTAVKELCAFWPCGSCVVFVGLFVGFRCGCPWEAGWCCCLPSSHIKWTLPATPLWHRYLNGCY